MVKLIAVSRVRDGFSIVNLSVKSLDMKEISRKFNEEISGWGFNKDDCEIFQQSKTGTYHWVARRTGRGWSRIAVTVKNWDKYATPSWKKIVAGSKR